MYMMRIRSRSAKEKLKEGIFDYAEYAGTAAALYMNDGEGHSVTYEIPADAEQAAATEAATEKQTEATVTEAVTEKQTEDLEEENGLSAGKIAAYLIALAAIVAVVVLVVKRKK